MFYFRYTLFRLLFSLLVIFKRRFYILIIESRLDINIKYNLFNIFKKKVFYVTLLREYLPNIYKLLNSRLDINLHIKEGEPIYPRYIRCPCMHCYKRHLTTTCCNTLNEFTGNWNEWYHWFDEHDVIDYEHVAWAYSLRELRVYRLG